MVIKKNYKKTGCGPPYSQLWQEKTLEVRGDLIAIKIEERASWIYQEVGGGGETVNIQLNGSQERDRRNIQNMSPKRAAAQPLQNNLVNMKIFILLKNIRLIIISKTPNPFNLKLG